VGSKLDHHKKFKFYFMFLTQLINLHYTYYRYLKVQLLQKNIGCALRDKQLVVFLSQMSMNAWSIMEVVRTVAITQSEAFFVPVRLVTVSDQTTAYVVARILYIF